MSDEYCHANITNSKTIAGYVSHETGNQRMGFPGQDFVIEVLSSGRFWKQKIKQKDQLQLAQMNVVTYNFFIIYTLLLMLTVLHILHKRGSIY